LLYMSGIPTLEWQNHSAEVFFPSVTTESVNVKLRWHTLLEAAEISLGFISPMCSASKLKIT